MNELRDKVEHLIGHWDQRGGSTYREFAEKLIAVVRDSDTRPQDGDAKQGSACE